jgi:hypothetical protein
LQHSLGPQSKHFGSESEPPFFLTKMFDQGPCSDDVFSMVLLEKRVISTIGMFLFQSFKTWQLVFVSKDLSEPSIIFFTCAKKSTSCETSRKNPLSPNMSGGDFFY